MTDERDPHDNYETPAEAVHQLLSNVRLDGGVLDPSCGRGNLVKVLYDANVLKVVGSDKYKYDMVDGVPKPMVMDFMTMAKPPMDITNIVMNPPYSQADAHVRHALKIVPSNGKLCVLLRLTWMAAKKRSDLLNHLSKIIIVGRLKMLPPDVRDDGFGGAVDFAWFIFESRVVRATEIVRAK